MILRRFIFLRFQIDDHFCQSISHPYIENDVKTHFSLVYLGAFCIQADNPFTGSDYNEIKQVYSIWICMNMKENSLSHIHMVKDDLLGDQDWKGNLDIPNIVMIGLAKEIPPKEERYELHRLLGTLLSQTMTAEQKLKLMKQEYDIPVDRHSIREEVKIMCNLSEGVEEMGYVKGEAAGIAKGKIDIILKMHKKGYNLEQIMDVTEMSEAEIKAIIG